jgi:hypothetical protein
MVMSTAPRAISNALPARANEIATHRATASAGAIISGIGPSTIRTKLIRPQIRISRDGGMEGDLAPFPRTIGCRLPRGIAVNQATR